MCSRFGCQGSSRHTTRPTKGVRCTFTLQASERMHRLSPLNLLLCHLPRAGVRLLPRVVRIFHWLRVAGRQLIVVAMPPSLRMEVMRSGSRCQSAAAQEGSGHSRVEGRELFCQYRLAHRNLPRPRRTGFCRSWVHAVGRVVAEPDHLAHAHLVISLSAVTWPGYAVRRSDRPRPHPTAGSRGGLLRRLLAVRLLISWQEARSRSRIPRLTTKLRSVTLVRVPVVHFFRRRVLPESLNLQFVSPAAATAWVAGLGVRYSSHHSQNHAVGPCLGTCLVSAKPINIANATTANPAHLLIALALSRPRELCGFDLAQN